MLLSLFAPLGAVLGVAFADLFRAPGDLFGETRRLGDPLLYELRQLRCSGDRVGGHALLGVVGSGVVHGPFADLDIGEPDIDPGCVRLHFADDGARGDVAHVGRLFEIGDVECQDNVDAFVAAIEVRREIERWSLGKLRREPTSHTDAPSVSASSTT